MLNSEWAAADAALFTAVVVAVTAFATFRQLRHGRNANDIVVYLRLVDFMDAPTTVAARARLRAMADRARDPAFLERLHDPTFAPDEMADVGRLMGFLEHIAVLITKGGVAEALVLTEYADTFVSMWEMIRPAILARRIAFGPHTGRAFEHLSMRAKQYIDSGSMDRYYAALASDTRALPGAVAEVGDAAPA